MYIKKFDKDYTRRHFMETAGKVGVTAGVLTPLWDLICKTGDSYAAYPDEVWDIESYSKGQVKVGGELNAGNVDAVKDLLDPIAYMEIKQDSRIIDIVEPVTDATKLMPQPYMEATLRNQGKAQFDSAGNVVTADGQPWIGGNPFPEADTAQKALCGHAMSWGKHDTFLSTVKEWDTDKDGNDQYGYEFVWIEVQATGRYITDPKPYMPGHEDKLRYNTALYTYPGDVAGSSHLNIWHYDQRKFPDYHGYLPAFKRIRRFPTNQRFEPTVPGSTFYISDAWTIGDPFLTWGNFKLVGRKPMLGHVSSANWHPKEDNWIHPTVGGKKGNKYFRTAACIVPEVIVVDMEPTGFTRAPYSKKQVYLDARSLTPLGHITYDRKGDLWKHWEIGACTYEKPDGEVVKLGGIPLWTWTHVHSYDSQAGYMSRFMPPQTVAGGYTIRINEPEMYENFCTMNALRRLGT